MGRELCREFSAARHVFAEADDALGFAISTLCFEGPEDKLMLTEITQPAILTNSIAVLRTLQSEVGLEFDVAAGHSLGEYCALVAAGALSLRDAVTLVQLRGKAMQRAVAPGVGGMAAIMGLEADAVLALCHEVRGDKVCAPANFNGGGQIVISGHSEAIERAVTAAKERGARRAVTLKVSAPFHCELMAPAAEVVGRALQDIAVGELAIPVIANVDAEPNRDRNRVKKLLVEQVTCPVRWDDSVKKLAALGVERAYELGSGSVLRGLSRRIVKELPVTTIGEPNEVLALQSPAQA
jgi:[acyl-carrier-protein] S-malonyltransferase